MATSSEHNTYAPENRGLSAQAKSRLSERVRGLALGKGLSQTKLRAQTGIAKSTLTELWKGTSDPKLSVLLKLAREFDLGSIEELLAPMGTGLMIDDMGLDA